MYERKWFCERKKEEIEKNEKIQLYPIFFCAKLPTMPLASVFILEIEGSLAEI